jgi:hypothetical protein
MWKFVRLKTANITTVLVITLTLRLWILFCWNQQSWRQRVISNRKRHLAMCIWRRITDVIQTLFKVELLHVNLVLGHLLCSYITLWLELDIAVSWNMTLCMCNNVSKQPYASIIMAFHCFRTPWILRQWTSPKCVCLFSNLHGLMSQKPGIVASTAVRTPDLSWSKLFGPTNSYAFKSFSLIQSALSVK